jgi:ABC-type transport system involved in multi-copper enzyme maturation permease subunit
MSAWLRLLRIEFFKLNRLVVTRAVVLSIILGPLVMVAMLRLATNDVRTVVEDPGDIVLISVVLLAGVGAVVMAAATFGREYDLGTGRGMLMRGSPRVGIVVAKTAAMLAVAGVTGVVACGLGAIGMRAVSWQPSPSDAVRLVAQTGGLAVLVGLSYTGAAALGAIVGQSTTAGMLGGLTFFLGDFLLGTVRTRLPLSDWMPVSNLFTVAGIFESAIAGQQTRSPLDSTLRLLMVGAGLVFAAGLLFRRQDVTR